MKPTNKLVVVALAWSVLVVLMTRVAVAHADPLPSPQQSAGTCAAYTAEGKLIAEATAPLHADGESHDWRACLRVVWPKATKAVCDGQTGKQVPFLLRAGAQEPTRVTAYCAAP